jgi:hypothetical protein
MADTDIRFFVTGQRERGSRMLRPATERSGDGKRVELVARQGRDAVALTIEGGPTLLLHPQNARDLLLAQGEAAHGRELDGTTVEVGARLRWRGLDDGTPIRGFVGDVLLAGIEILAKPAGAVTANLAARRIDGQVDGGVYALDETALTPLKGSGKKLAQVPSPGDGGPVLILVHGTFVDTAGTFAKLWAGDAMRLRRLFDAYHGHVYALDHPTLGTSPIANALMLVQALPPGTRLHLLTHSRGGLVAEVLARVAALPRMTEVDLVPFAGEAYASQRADLQQLAATMADRSISVERVVRVACPARGTLLASSRLDAYLSVLKWGLELAQIPVLPALVDFLGAVAVERASPEHLPGLAAMMPGSPLVQWLNSAPAPVPGELRVVAGDLEGDTVMSWLKTLLADAYYWTDNDLVVQTRSMYGGAPRAGSASFLLDKGGRTTHFAYFANARTADAVVDALTQERPDDLQPIGPLSWAGEDAGGQRAARRSLRDGAAAADRPAVFVLPDFLGSHLKVGGRRVWLNDGGVGGMALLRYAPGDGVSADTPIGLVYDELMDHLAVTHEVIGFGFDWRRPLEDEARRLGAAVEAALDARSVTGQPVRLLGHSMGGLLARTMQLECPATWQRMMAVDGARLLMLGTPNAGSWSPMQVLSGDDSFGNAISGFGVPLQDHLAREVMADMPGLLQLQAGLGGPQQLERSATWQALAKADQRAVQERTCWHVSAGEAFEAAYRWGVPSQAVLDQALALRRRLDDQLVRTPPEFAAKMVLVVGHAKVTPGGFEQTEDGTVLYIDAANGDGRVSIESALLPGVATWRLDAAHGDLPSSNDAFAAFDELLTQGDTQLLERWQLGTARDAPASTPLRRRPSREALGAGPPAHPLVLAEATRRPRGRAIAAPGSEPLRVAVLNGNLTFVTLPLMVGHYRSRTLTGTERVLDRRVGGAMSSSLAAGLYPDVPGTAQVFSLQRRSDGATDPWRGAPMQHVVVVGLGDEGRLAERDLIRGARQGAMAWAQWVGREGDSPATFEIAATLIGSGGIGVHAATAARAIAQGVRQANDALGLAGWPVVSRLTLVELYLNRASEAWRGLQVLAIANPTRFAVEPTITFGNGPLRRPVDSGYRGADYDLITATRGAEGTIEFRLDSKRARTEVRAQVTQALLVRELVRTTGASPDAGGAEIGRTLFQLLVPTEIEPFLGGTGRALLEVDQATAPIPWELLDTPAERRTGSDPRPWAVRSQLLRKLRTRDYRETVRDATVEDNILVIGEPLIDDPRYPALPGALAEALAVQHAFAASGAVDADHLVALVSRPDAPTIIGALLGRSYRVVHIAGHGEAGPAGGVVMSGGTFLGPREIATMRTVPELVFVNCCHGAARDASYILQDRSAFAASLADELIRIGVHCVVAAGWAVDDLPAKEFAAALYGELLRGHSFVDAVAAAREVAWQLGGNTWAAYQCYGDPNWTLRRGVADAAAPRSARVGEETQIASPVELVLALEELTVQSRWQGEDPKIQFTRLQQLEQSFGEIWGTMGAVAEAFGLAHAEAGARDSAIHWYRRAQHCGDASASMRVPEQLGNLLARQAWAGVLASDVAEPAVREQQIAQARAQLADAVGLLERTAALAPTMERMSLIGSAWKRLAMLERRSDNNVAERQALANSAKAYADAVKLADALPQRFYPALNHIAAELVAGFGNRAWNGLTPGLLADARQAVQDQVQLAPDFWSVVAGVEAAMYGALEERDAARARMALEAAFADVRARASSPALWASVADQAAFVLAPYAAASSGNERAAAQALLALLQGFAGQPTNRLTLARAAPREREVMVLADGVDSAFTDTLVAQLRTHSLQIWSDLQLTRAGNPVSTLPHALAQASGCVVVVGASASGRSWDLVLEQAMQRPDFCLVALAVDGATVPPFLRAHSVVPMASSAEPSRAIGQVAKLLAVGRS